MFGEDYLALLRRVLGIVLMPTAKQPSMVFPNNTSVSTLSKQRTIEQSWKLVAVARSLNLPAPIILSGGSWAVSV